MKRYRQKTIIEKFCSLFKERKIGTLSHWKRIRHPPKWVEKRAVNTLTPFHKMYIKGKTFWYKAYYYVGNVQGDSGIIYWRKLRHKRNKCPLKRIGKRWYWKGIPTDDDWFTNDPKLIREYNQYIKKLKRKRKKK